ncbi:MAG: carboxypeptidase-like regulatory domain-containing protein, partial [Bacteroidota bacterium]
MNVTFILRSLIMGCLVQLLCMSIYAQSSVISGYISDQSSGEKLINATIIETQSQKGAITNNYGFYSLKLPQGPISLRINYAGHEVQVFEFDLKADTLLNVALTLKSLDEVEIVASNIEREVDQTQMSKIDVPIEQIKSLPALGGEVDVVKVIQLLPGVQSGTEGSTGLYVRGGSPDQNLITLDGVPLYYVSHLGGFFSVFNADALSSVQLYKGGFPARYGGRLSSILDVRMKEGNLNEFHGEGNVSLIASKLSLEGPIVKGKSSFIISGRRTYIDLLTRPLTRLASGGEGSAGYYFYDLNGKVNYIFSDKDRLYGSFYLGRDVATINTNFSSSGGGSDYEEEFKFGLGWGNRLAAVRWNHLWRKNLFSNLTATYSQYQLRTNGDGRSEATSGDSVLVDEFGLDYRSRIRDWGLKFDFDYYPSPAHDIKFGVQSTYHKFVPSSLGITQASEGTSLDTTFASKIDTTLESGLYIEDNIKIGKRFSANIGLHLAHYYNFTDKLESFSLQPRASARLAISDKVAIKASYVQMTQFIHLLTNSGVGLPIDLWVPATAKVPRQDAWQAAAGISASLFDDQISLSVEGYYKEMRGLIAFKEGNNFFFGGLNSGTWESTVETGGEGTAYGGEFLIQKKQGRTTGWIGYTLSWNYRRFDNINNGERFPFKYDRRHDISIVVVHKLKKNITLSGTWVFGTGNAINLPTGGFATLQDPFFTPGVGSFGGSTLTNPFYRLQTQLGGFSGSGILYEEGRNGFRFEPYHRLDLGINFIKKKKWGERIWSISAYNAYSRLNPFTYYYRTNTVVGELPNGDFGVIENNTSLVKAALFPII